MRLSKTITYYYPDGENPSAVKVFQDRSSQVRGFRFKKEYLSLVQKEKHSDGYGIYFLLGENHGIKEKREVYVGQSKLGIQRIISHNRNKDFWVDCIMFVSDNNIFDTNAIDYMEYYFINLIKKSPQYALNNIEPRNKEPNLNYLDKMLYETYLTQIEFLLKAEGIYLGSKQDEDALQSTSGILQSKPETTSNEHKENYDSSKLYFVKDKRYNASARYENGLFILTKGSIIHKPRKRMLNWQDGGKLYRRIIKEQSEYEERGLLEDMGDKYKVLSEIPFKSPSGAGIIVIGSAVYGGWDLFENLEELR